MRFDTTNLHVGLLVLHTNRLNGSTEINDRNDDLSISITVMT
mgnify:CR=1 FL=1